MYSLVQLNTLQIAQRSVYVCNMVNKNHNIENVMRKVLLIVGVIVGLFILINSAQALHRNIFIYGEVETVDGDKYEGYLRWGTDEVYWFELLNAQKTSNDFLKFLSNKEIEDLANQSSGNSWLNIDLGVLSIWEDKLSRTNHRFDTRFGDIKLIEPIGKSKARITIKNGVILEVTNEGGYYTDIGGAVRLMDNELGEINLKWSRIEKITFMSARENDLTKPFGQPIYGKVDAGRKGTFTGLIHWDEDERFQNEILNGKDSGDDRKIPFKNIRSIEKEKNGVVVTLKSDRELRLTDSNDVNNKNRGIIVFDPEIGRIDIPWRDFMNLEIIEKR